MTDDQVKEALGSIWMSALDYKFGEGWLLRWLVAHDAKVQAEQREEDARIAESDQFWDPRGEVLSSDEVSYNVARREAAAAIRAVPANTNTEEPQK